MKRLASAVVLLSAVGVCLIWSQTSVSATYVLPIVVSGAGDPVINAHLTGDHEIPARDTRAQGQVTLRVSRDGTSVSYTLIASNIDNVVAAHIHIGSAAVNGPVTVFLYGPAAPGGGPQDGVLATGTFTASDLIGPLAGQQIADLLDEIAAGNAYVNVHTNDGVAPTDTGPGDFPGGEIRGQLDGKGKR